MADPTATPAPGAISHERPALDVSAPAPSADGPSEYEAHRIARGMEKAPTEPAPETPAIEARSETPNPLSGPPEPPEAPDTDTETPAKGPEGVTTYWRDPDTGTKLDMRRKDHRRIRRLLEERADFARRLSQPPPQAQQPQPPPQRVAQPPQPDPRDPEPQLEQFADSPDPYAAHMRAAAKWEARQEFRQQTAQRTSVERGQRVQTAIDSAQHAFDAKLPEVRERYPDFDQAHQELYETLGRVPLARRGPIVHRLLTSPVRHEYAYYLGNHPEDLARLTHARTPHEQAIALGAIEARVQHSLTAAPAQTSTTRAPAPTTPVNTGGPSVRRDLGQIAKDGDYQSYRASRGMPATGANATR